MVGIRHGLPRPYDQPHGNDQQGDDEDDKVPFQRRRPVIRLLLCTLGRILSVLG